VSYGWEPGGPLTTAMMVMAFIGAFTALFAALIAMAQNDIKRVLAYSTISQLGYMIAALGVGAYTAAAFHLFTHAFFKALLFLGSGSVIHGMEHGVMHTGAHLDPQDMWNMGGLWKKMPFTFLTFLVGGLALSGFPLVTAGFWSKDEILSGAFNGGYLLVFITLALAALLTAFYTMRQITLTFLGKPRSGAAEHAHESRWTMTLPLVILSLFAIGAGWVGIPESFPGLGGLLPNWFEEFVSGTLVIHPEGEVGHSLIPLFTSLGVALGGLVLGWLVYRGAGEKDPLQVGLGPVHRLLKNKFYFDELYHWALVRPAAWISETFTSAWMDRGLIDGFLHGVARASLGLGNFLRNAIDLPVWNRGGDALAGGVGKFGASLKPFQSGRVQQYLVTAILLTVVFAAVLYLVFRTAA
jgi:NADH-quinone oxidoreductase subunit L